MSIKILQYKGTGWVSRAIRFQTRSVYSHTGILFESDGKVFEAWHTGGKRWWHGSVRVLDKPKDGHDPDTQIDVFRIEGYVDESKARAYAESMLGRRYDFLSVLRFVTRKKAPDNTAVFCTEYALDIISDGDLDLLRGNHAHMSPRDMGISPLLHYEKTL